MTGTIQSSTAPVGAAPQATAAAQLPSLTSGQQQATTTASTTPTAATPAAAPAAADPFAAINGMLAQAPDWLGPLVTIGGVALTAFAFAKGKSALWKFGGISSAVSGAVLTGAVAGAKGNIQGRAAAEAEILPIFQAYEQETNNAILTQQQQYEATIAQLQQQLNGGGTGTPTTPGTDAGAPTTPGTDTGTGTPVVDVPTTTPATGPVGSIVGTTLTLPAGTAGASQIAAAGPFTIAGIVGDANGYATLAQANAAVQSTVSTTTSGSRQLRWVVVENGGRFYGAVAQAGDSGSAFTSQLGSIVAWNALNHLDGVGWQAYTWTKDGGAQAISVPYGQDTVFPAGSTAPTAPTTSTPGTTTFNVATAIGRTFQINDAVSPDGVAARGGVLQLQQLVGAATGYGTPEEAAAAARQARAGGGGTEWTRWVSTQGSDGRYYVFQGSIVNASTEELQTASPLHVFGNGFAEYYDGASASWKSVRDA